MISYVHVIARVSVLVIRRLWIWFPVVYITR